MDEVEVIVPVAVLLDEIIEGDGGTEDIGINKPMLLSDVVG